MKILYGVQTTGNGHLTRSVLIIHALRRLGHDVDVFLSGSASTRDFALSLFPNARFVVGPTLLTQQGRLQLWKTVFNAEVRVFIRAVRQLSVSEYDLVMTDFEPITTWAAKFGRKLSIGVSNQYAITHNATRFPGYSPLATLIDRFFAPARIRFGLHWKNFGPFILPPVIPVDALDALSKVNQGDHVVVYLPFESLEDIATFLSTQPSVQFEVFHPEVQSMQHDDHIHWLPLNRDSFLARLASSQGLVSSAGFETLSEAIYLGKKILVKALSGQAEQLSNAQVLEQQKLGVAMASLDTRILSDWLEQPATSSRAPGWPNVAREIAAWVDAGDFKATQRLHDMCWSVS